MYECKHTFLKYQLWNVSLQVRIHAWIDTPITYICIYVYTYTHTYIQTLTPQRRVYLPGLTPSQPQVSMHAYEDRCMHNIYIYIHTHIYTHKHTLKFLCMHMMMNACII